MCKVNEFITVLWKWTEVVEVVQSQSLEQESRESLLFATLFPTNNTLLDEKLLPMPIVSFKTLIFFLILWFVLFLKAVK